MIILSQENAMAWGIRFVAEVYSRQKLNLAGQRYGKLTVIAPAANIGRDTAWLCRCDCGAETTVKTAYLRRGTVRTCGCNTNETKYSTIGV